MTLRLSNLRTAALTLVALISVYLLFAWLALAAPEKVEASGRDIPLKLALGAAPKDAPPAPAVPALATPATK